MGRVLMMRRLTDERANITNVAYVAGDGAAGMLRWDWPPHSAELDITAACVICANSADGNAPLEQLSDMLDRSAAQHICTRDEYHAKGGWPLLPQYIDAMPRFRVFSMAVGAQPPDAESAETDDRRTIYDQPDGANLSPTFYRRRTLEYSVKYSCIGRSYRDAKIVFSDPSMLRGCPADALVYEKQAKGGEALPCKFPFNHKDYVAAPDRFRLLVGRGESVRLAVNPEMPDLIGTIILTPLK
jgi:hypothetical protein